MSSDLFISMFEQGKEAFFPFVRLKDAFGGAIVAEDSEDGHHHLCLDYPVAETQAPCLGGTPQRATVPITDSAFIDCRSCLHGAERVISGFTVNRPATHADFWRAIYCILQCSYAALFWPGDNALVIGQAATLPHLPADMVAALGEPWLVTESQQVIARIRAS